MFLLAKKSSVYDSWDLATLIKDEGKQQTSFFNSLRVANMDAFDRDALITVLVIFVAYGLGRAGLLPQNSFLFVVAVILLAVFFIFAAVGL